MNFQLIIFVTAVCGLSAIAAQNSPRPTLSENEKLISNGVKEMSINLLKYIHQKAGPEENIVFSPTCIYQALALLHLASNGQTRNEVAKVMGLPQDDSKVTAIHETLSQISKKIQSKPANAYEVLSELSMASGIFVQENFPIKPEFAKQVLNYYGGNVTNLDFAKKSKEATDGINQWVSEKTKGRIQKLYAEPLDPSTLAVLTSSLYFNAKWKEPFPASKTKVEKFNTGATEIDVSMMNDQQFVRYVSDSKWKIDAITLPYNDEIHMDIILPQSSQTVHNLTDKLTSKELREVMKKREVTGVDYKIPKMKFSWNKSIKDTLSSIGMEGVFKGADLSNLALSPNLAVSDVNHAAEIEAEEQGTKASAVTGIQVIPVSYFPPPTNPVKFYVNRPFIFYIFHRPQQMVLFSGIVHNPVQN